jgi:hypothetical protein
MQGIAILHIQHYSRIDPLVPQGYAYLRDYLEPRQGGDE